MSKAVFLLLGVVVVVIDQLTKYIAISSLTPYVELSIVPGVSLMLAFNTGAAFSILSNAGSWHLWFFKILGPVVCVVMCFWFFRLSRNDQLQARGLILIIAGALGNIVDRFHYGYVVDFILLSYRNYFWPVFNVADMAITAGAILMIFAAQHQTKA